MFYCFFFLLNSSPFYDIFTIKFIISIQTIALETAQFRDVFYWKIHQKLNIRECCNGLSEMLRLPMSNALLIYFFEALKIDLIIFLGEMNLVAETVKNNQQQLSKR